MALGVIALVAGIACGGSSGNASAGDASAAVAEYWKQEQAGGLLPEGTGVLQVGVQSPVKLKAESGEKGRYCVVFTYLEREQTQTQHARVYRARLIGDVWSVDVVKPEGDCDGVS
jgi:hypothetical protein